MRRKPLAPARVISVVAIVGVLVLATGVFRSPRAIVRAALRDVDALGTRQVTVALDVLPPERLRSVQRFHARAEGDVHLARRSFPRVVLTGETRIRRRGGTLIYRADIRAADRGVYLKFLEFPFDNELSRRLERAWLRLAEPTDASPDTGTARAVRALLTGLTSRAVLTKVERQERESLAGVSVHRYRVTLNDDAAREALQKARDQAESDGVRPVAQYLAGLLTNFRLESLDLWVTPRSHTLVRARVVLKPRAEQLAGAELILDARALPRRGDVTVEIPKRSLHFRRADLLLRLVGFR